MKLLNELGMAINMAVFYENFVVSRVCGCCRYRPASEGDDASATSPKKTKGDNKSQKTVRRKMDELWNGELFLKMY